MRRQPGTVAVAGLLIVALGWLTGCGGDPKPKRPATPNGPVITIGTKNFTEQFILGELYAQALRANGFRVRLKSDIGASEIVDRALTAGSLDMYPEYTGVMLSELAGNRERPSSAAAAYRDAKAFQEKRGFTLLAMTPFSDQNALAVTPGFARRHRLRSIGDLARLPGTVEVGAPPEFRTRFEGISGLRQLYGLDRIGVRVLLIGEQYSELDRGRISVANVFTTDGQLEAGRYTLLSDPRALFAFQNVAPVVRKDLVRRYPRLRAVLDSVSVKLTTAAMRRMNADAVQRKRPPAVVASRFLRRVGLLK
jgi:osmoprotectant transport system substrate-binding protein